jgi:hypothetical protein
LRSSLGDSGLIRRRLLSTKALWLGTLRARGSGSSDAHHKVAEQAVNACLRWTDGQGRLESLLAKNGPLAAVA